MKVLVVYDSMFGNTLHLARVIAETLRAEEPVSVLAANVAGERDLVGIDLLAVGGPTQGHGLSPPLRDFLNRIPPNGVRGVPVVVFSTRLNWPRFLAGSASAQAANRLLQKGAQLLVPPESFLVAGKEGPLLEGELERARAWASDVRAAAGESQRAPALATR